uniref:Uncharacterized protein n=1 Tax=Rhizophora mucronata TaxID=61149 RepID=A0A2P2QWK0_RHIMU
MPIEMINRFYSDITLHKADRILPNCRKDGRDNPALRLPKEQWH